MNQLSIIVPIYNVSDYLRQCLDSIILQMRDDWELILVNDGSTDDSLFICQQYAKNRDNIRIINKNNGGLSDARNAGTLASTGEWVCYIDSDDWVSSDGILKLYEFATQNDCEVVQGGFFYAYEDYLIYDNRWFDVNSDPLILNRSEAMHELIHNNFVKNFAWGKIYKTEIVRKYQFPKGKFFEDVYWQHLVFNNLNKFGVIHEPIYYYRQRENGISGTFSIRKMDYLYGLDLRAVFLADNYPDFLQEMKDEINKQALIHARLAFRSGDKMMIDIMNKYLEEKGIKYNPILQSIKDFLPRVYNHFFSKRLRRIDL